MTAKEVKFGDSARKRLAAGVNILANAVKTPLLGFFCPAKPHTPTRWGPYDQQKWVVTPTLDSPEICKFNKCPHGGCLQQLSDSKITTELCENRLKNLT